MALVEQVISHEAGGEAVAAAWSGVVTGLEPRKPAHSVGHPPRLFPHLLGPRGPGAECERWAPRLHSNLLGCGWERLRPTVLTISPCSHEPHREQERESGGWGMEGGGP